MDLSAYIRRHRGQVLRPGAVNKRVTVTFMDEGQIVRTRYGSRLFISVKTEKGDTGVLILGKMNVERLVRLLGPETKSWLGKKVELRAVNYKISGQTRLGWIVEPTEAEKKRTAILESLEAGKAYTLEEIEKLVRETGKSFSREEIEEALRILASEGLALMTPTNPPKWVILRG